MLSSGEMLTLQLLEKKTFKSYLSRVVLYCICHLKTQFYHSQLVEKTLKGFKILFQQSAILLYVSISGKFCHHNNSRTFKSCFGKSRTFYIIHGSSCKQNLWHGIPGSTSRLFSPQQVRHPRKFFRFIAFRQKIPFNNTQNNVLIFLINHQTILF